jgi:hypothetical protein
MKTRLSRASSGLGALFLAGLLGTSLAVRAAEETARYYLAQTMAYSPEGKQYGPSISLYKRVLKPSENLIEETILAVDPMLPSQQQTMVFGVDGSKLSIKSAAGVESCTGELTGKAWEWTAWKYEFILNGRTKGSLKTEVVSKGETISSTKTFYTVEGQPKATFKEELLPISKDTYEILQKKLQPPPSLKP